MVLNKKIIYTSQPQYVYKAVTHLLIKVQYQWFSFKLRLWLFQCLKLIIFFINIYTHNERKIYLSLVKLMKWSYVQYNHFLCESMNVKANQCCIEEGLVNCIYISILNSGDVTLRIECSNWILILKIDLFFLFLLIAVNGSMLMNDLPIDLYICYVYHIQSYVQFVYIHIHCWLINQSCICILFSKMDVHKYTNNNR